MPLSQEDIEAQRQYANDTGSDLDSLKTFTKEYIDVLRYRGTPLEEEKTKLANEREILEQRSLAASSKNKSMRYTLPVRAPMPSIPVKGVNVPTRDTPLTDKKLDDVINAVNDLQIEQAPESVTRSLELVEPIAEPVVTNDPVALSNSEEDNTPVSTSPLKSDPVFLPAVNAQSPEQQILPQQPLESVSTLPTLTPQSASEEEQPVKLPPISQTSNLITNNTNTLAPSPAIVPTSFTPVNSDAQNITAVLEATTPKPPEFGEERDVDSTNSVSSIQSSLPGAAPEISSKTAILPKAEFIPTIEENNIRTDVDTVIDENDIMAQEREIATQAKKEEDVKDSIIEKERKLANEDIVPQEKEITAQVEKEQDVKDSIIEKERKLANEDIVSEERENAAAQAREEQVVEGAGMENISKQLKSVRELFGNFAAKKPETNGLDIKSAVTLIRPIADTLVSINNSVLTILNRLADLPGQGGINSPVLNNSMGIPPNTTTINDGAITMARDTFRAHSGVAYSTGPRSSTPGFMV